MSRRGPFRHRCHLCGHRFEVHEVAEPFWGSLPEPQDCPRCAGVVRRSEPTTVGDARELVLRAAGLKPPHGRDVPVAEHLAGRCTTAAEVQRLLRSVERLDWDVWRRRLQSRPEGMNEEALRRWPQLLTLRDDGSLRTALEVAAAQAAEQFAARDAEDRARASGRR